MNTRRTTTTGPRLVLLLVIALWGCGPPRLAVRPAAYELDLRLDPARHALQAQVVLELEQVSAPTRPAERGLIELKLHPDLAVGAIEAEGTTIRSHRTRAGGVDEDGGITPSTHRLILEPPGASIRLSLRYEGELFQDVEAGEEAEQVHNFVMAAHVGDDGIYLEPDGYWYPTIELPDGDDPDASLSEFALSADRVDGFELVAGLESRPTTDDGRLHWSSPFPLDGLVLLGGPLTRWSSRHGDVALHAVLDPAKGDVAEDVLAAAAEYLERYEPLIGPYPFSEFTVLEAFFSSGFAFPTCTQIAGSQISEYRQYRRHGYLDHELLHNWWGNGVLVHPDDGNWCEALSSYLGNYYGYVLDGDEAGARKQRRNNSNFLSAIEPDEDLPLGTFGQTDGVGRGVGYMKGSAVFHMLERTVGTDAFFAGLRRFADGFMGRHADWSDLREAIEHESGVDLERFFEQWVRRGGAPSLRLLDATRGPGPGELSVTLSQGDTDFLLDVPLRLYHDGGSRDIVVTLDAPEATIRVDAGPELLTAVELDPDYHVFRKLEPQEIMPTSNLTRRGEQLLVVVPSGEELADGYQVVVDSYSRSVLGDKDERKKGHSVVVREAEQVTADELESSSVLLIGDAVRSPTVEAFLGRTNAPVAWDETGFRVETNEYRKPGHALFFTAHHPELERAGVTVYFGNSASALSNARVLSYYPNSLLVFETPLSDEPQDEGEMPRAEVLQRIDFESHDRVDL